MATVKLFLDTRSKKKNDLYPIKLVVNHKQTSLIGLGISITKEQWNGKEVIYHPKAKLLNAEPKQKLVQAENIIIKITNIRSLTQKELLYRIEQNNTEPEPIQEYKVSTHFQKYIAQCKAKKTAELYTETLRKLSPDITFNQITFQWLKSFDRDLSTTNSINTRSGHMMRIRSVFNDAINEDLVSIAIYPFRKFTIKTEKTVKRSLTLDKLIKFRDYKVEPHQEKYRDLFMLQFYLIGISLIDLLNLTTIEDGRVEYYRRKTGAFYSIKLIPEAVAILDRYKGEKYLLNILDDGKNYKEFRRLMNSTLKQIGRPNPLFPKLTTYFSRHSWATLASSIDIPIETISACLGHKYGSEMTQGYIDFDRSKIDKANRKVADLLITKLTQ